MDLKFEHLKGNMNKLILVIFVVVLIYTSGVFIAPLTLEPGEVEELDGAANRIVYSEKWEELPLYHRVVYQFSDLNCHQKYYRSYSINGNQMPLCARCVGMFLGFTAGFLMMSFVRGGKELKDLLLELVNLDTDLSEKKKLIILILLGSVFALPMILDGGLQAISDYESFNEFRTFTGLLFGVGFSVLISALLLSTTPVGHYQDSSTR